VRGVAKAPGECGLLFIAPTLGTGGAERQWATLLPALAEKGLAPHVIALAKGGQFADELQNAGVPVEILGCGAGSAVVCGVARALRQRPRVIITMGTNANLVGVIGAKLGRAEHIVNWHVQADKPLRLRRRAIMRLCARLGSSVIAVTEAQSAQLKSLGFAPEAITIIGNGTAVPKPVREPAETRKLLGIQPTTSLVLGVGRLSPEKKFGRFIDAIACLRARGVAVAGVIAGDGPERDTLERQIRRSGGGTLLLGARADVADLYAAADVLCMTSDLEALPMVILEAFASRLPVVVPAVGGISELIDDGKEGVVVREQSPVAYADGIVRVIGGSKIEEMRRAAYSAYAARFTDATMVGLYIDRLTAADS